MIAKDQQDITEGAEKKSIEAERSSDPLKSGDIETHFGYIILVLIVSLTFQIVNGAIEGNYPVGDDMIENSIERQLQFDPSVFSNDVDVLSDKGIVTLEGKVDSLRAKERAESLAASRKGVLSVINRLIVRPTAKPDPELKANVDTALQLDTVTNDLALETQVKDGVVTLKGGVASFGVRRLAEMVVADVSGVVEVDNQLVIDWESSMTNEDITAEINAILDNDIFVDTSFMEVKVEDATAFLSGKIGSVVGKNRAERKAYVPGVSYVDGTKLKVVPELRDSDRKMTRFTTISDGTVKSIIEETFEMDPRINPFTPEVYVSKGYVTLKGTVNTLKAKESAGRNAKNTTGVRQVFNFLKVRPTDSITDEEVKTNIIEGLRLNPFTESHDLSVTVRNGRVSVEGVVESLYESEQVSAVISGIAGVRAIRNYTTTKSGATPGISGQFAAPAPLIRSIDTGLETEIEEEIKWNWFLDSSNVDVDVRNGMVTLEGEVSSLWEKERAENEARKAGANVIINQLKVK